MASAVASTSALLVSVARPLRPRPAASSSRKKRVARSPSPSGSEYADSHDDERDSDDSGAGEPEQLDDDSSEHSDSNSDSGGDDDASDDDDELLEGDRTDQGTRRRRRKKAGERRKKYPCTWPGCGKVYARPTRLDEHARGHTGERPYQCPDCDASFARDSHLKAHRRSHLSDSEKQYACEEPGCDKRFWTNQHMKKHFEVVHRGKTYDCTHCNRSFRKHHQLRTHVAEEHSKPGTQPFICDHPGCEKSFKQKVHLKAHEKTHDLSRYACVHPDCIDKPTPERQFGTWTLLQRHTKSAHPPTCPHAECEGKTFTTRRGLRNHLLLHERDAREDVEGMPKYHEDGRRRRRRRRRGKKRPSEAEVAGEGEGEAEGEGGDEDEEEVEEGGSDWEQQQEDERDERMREDFRYGGKKKRKVLHEAAGFPPILPLPPSLAGSPVPALIPDGLPTPPDAFLVDAPDDAPPVALPLPPPPSFYMDLITGANYAPAVAPVSSPAGPRGTSPADEADFDPQGSAQKKRVYKPRARAPKSRGPNADPNKYPGSGLRNVPRRFKCPFPAILALPFIDHGPKRSRGGGNKAESPPPLDSGEEDDDDEEGTCRYVFKRTYDVERHLLSKHGLEMKGGRETLDLWFKTEAEGAAAA